MPRCSICGRAVYNPKTWVCGACALAYDLPVKANEWPDWAQSERHREAQRRRFEPGYGVSSGELSYSPYRRQIDNRTYRRASKVHKSSPRPAGRTQVDNLFYSTTRDGDDGRHYTQILESMPVDLRDRLLQHSEHQTILADAIRALPLVSQRAVLGTLIGRSIDEIATEEGIAESTMRWLHASAMDHLRALLAEQVDADDGIRYS